MSIELKHISYSYEEPGSAHSGREILRDINLIINPEDFTALIGPTGSGKSTLVQHLNLLLHAASGDILYDGESIYADGYDRKGLRSRVGMVFQYPEYQLFETDVITDVSFGPKNLGLDEAEARERAEQALGLVGLEKEFWTKSPFELSGGQKRRAAVAGVIAMKPRYLVLDEPAAGLDPKGRRELLDAISEIHKRAGIGILLVSHSMDDVAQYADKMIVLEGGQVRFTGTPKEVFRHEKELSSMGLSVPSASHIASLLRARGIELSEDIITIDELADAVTAAAAKGRV